MAEIAIIIPVLRRPERAQLIVDSITSNTVTPHRIVFVCTPSDRPQIAACNATGEQVLVTTWSPGKGDYARKINHGYHFTDEPYIFTGADDLNFHPAWDLHALAKFTDGIGVVGTNDLCNARTADGDLSTHSLVSRAYADTHGTIDGPGAIYVEVYPHEFVDDEFVLTAKSRGAYAHAPTSIVEHLHPNCGKAPRDQLHRLAPRRISEGRRIHNARRPRFDPDYSVPKVPISVIVATYGEEKWQQLATERAVPSIQAQQRVSPAELIVHHGANIAEARNEAALKATSPWLCFLDADDELHPMFMYAMSRHLHLRNAGILNPAVQFIIDGVPKRQKMFSTRNLRQGNYLVIGSVVKRDLFFEAGGFDPKYRAWEDWALWWRVVTLGGRVARVPNAIYISHWAHDGRNNTVDDPEGLRAEIQADYDAWAAERKASV